MNAPLCLRPCCIADRYRCGVVRTDLFDAQLKRMDENAIAYIDETACGLRPSRDEVMTGKQAVFEAGLRSIFTCHDHVSTRGANKHLMSISRKAA